LPSLFRHAGAARFAYNWGLRWKLNVMEYNRLPHPPIRLPTAIDLHRELNRLKKTKLAWMYELSKCAPQEALRDLDAGFRNFFDGRARFPRFKSRKRGPESFTLTGAIVVGPDIVRLPRIGWVRLKERGYIPSKKAHINSATVSERAGRWFVSVNVLEDGGGGQGPTPIQGPVTGVDRGVDRLLVASDGTSIENPKTLPRYRRKLRHIQRSLSRKKEGSANRRKAMEALRHIHYRIANVRRDAINKATTTLAKTKSVIVVEDLGVRNMMANHRLAGSIADAAMAEVVRQLEYKTAWYGSRLIRADRWYPSTKRCSGCGQVKERMGLSERVFRCDVCGLTVDRDLNAARNLEQWPGVARTLETPVEGGVQPRMVAQPPGEAGTTSLGRGPRQWTA
jgi:putative transposase